MRRAAACALLLALGAALPALGGEAAPAAAECRRAAEMLETLAPSLPAQTGLTTAAALLGDEAGRWPIAATAYTFADEARRQGRGGVPWAPMLWAADILERCFAGDPARAGGEMARRKAEFDALFPPGTRSELRRKAGRAEGQD